MKLSQYLEATDMGPDQQEIAEWIQSSEKWQSYVESVNRVEIVDLKEFLDSQEFHPDDLIPDAIEALGWNYRPSTGGVIMSFSEY